MAIVTDKKEVLGIYKDASERKWVIPCFCAENITTCEAILQAALDFSKERGITEMPVTIAITNQYRHRPQSSFYTHTRRWDIGLKLFIANLNILTAKGTPFENIQVMVHLDHAQYDQDEELLKWDMNQFSSIMYDASSASFEDNIRFTREFVEKHGSNILIEGACDEITDASGNEHCELTSADKAERYFKETGVDLIVANLGTEHRASAKELEYYGDYALRIKDRIGARIVLHGTSSISAEQLKNLHSDGICKVNIWTALERDSSPLLLVDMVKNASKVAGPDVVAQLILEGFLSEKCRTGQKADLSCFTTLYRQDIIFKAMKDIIYNYFALLYR